MKVMKCSLAFAMLLSALVAQPVRAEAISKPAISSSAISSSAISSTAISNPVISSLGIYKPVTSPPHTPIPHALVPMTQRDFQVSGTQVGNLATNALHPVSECKQCHGGYDPQIEPFATWAGSLMALGGRDPLFFAQMTTANQDVANVGSFCLRCHVPVSVVTGHVAQPDGTTLDAADKEGVGCHFCHSMVDPQFKPGISPPEDADILAALANLPQYIGNAMFVLDPQARRRGPYLDTDAPHTTINSDFHRQSAMCGTCHDVGNVAVSKLPDGRYRYNLIDMPTPDANLAMQFPLERTYTEWKLSEFAQGGVDLAGRFGGVRGPVVSSCQDCHMPTATGRGASYARIRTDLASHAFAGAAVPSLDLIAAYTAGDPEVDPSAIAAGRASALSMLQRAASVDLALDGLDLVARVTNQSGHKLPTGHIEGRRVWLNLQFFDASNALIAERGHYDTQMAELDETTTTVYEMHVGLSADAAAVTGYPSGVTAHMALADTIEKDTRIPPRGFNNAAYSAAGAPAVGISYSDGQYWHEQRMPLPKGTARVRARLYYQSTPRHYIEGLRDANVTDQWGEILHDAWQQTGRGAPIAMADVSLAITEALFRDGFE